MKSTASEWFATWTRTVVIGALTLLPFGLALWVLWLVMQVAAFVGGIIAHPFMSGIARTAPGIGEAFDNPVISFTLQIAFALALLTTVGALAGNMLGRTFGAMAARLIGRIPIANTVFSSARKLIESFQSPAENAQKVVLIEFPSPEMKAIGFVTRRFTAADTGEDLAAVYVPTTPNPTSGYVEIVPAARLVWLDWSANEAIQFIVSAGVAAPDGIRYRPSGPPPPITDPGT